VKRNRHLLESVHRFLHAGFLGNVVFALGHLRARFRSGLILDTEIGWLTRYGDGLAVRGRAYRGDIGARCRAAGV